MTWRNAEFQVFIFHRAEAGRPVRGVNLWSTRKAGCSVMTSYKTICATLWDGTGKASLKEKLNIDFIELCLLYFKIHLDYNLAEEIFSFLVFWPFPSHGGKVLTTPIVTFLNQTLQGQFLNISWTLDSLEGLAYIQTAEPDFCFCGLGWSSGRLRVPCMGSSSSADQALNPTGLGRIMISAELTGLLLKDICFRGTGTSSLSSSCSSKS